MSYLIKYPEEKQEEMIQAAEQMAGLKTIVKLPCFAELTEIEDQFPREFQIILQPYKSIIMNEKSLKEINNK